MRVLWYFLPGWKSFHQESFTEVCGLMGPEAPISYFTQGWASGKPHRRPFYQDQSSLTPTSVQFSSVAQLCPTLCDPMDCSIPGLLVYHQFPELLKFMSIELVMPSSHLILSCPLLLLSSIFPNIRVFSNLLALCIRWPKYWSFSFSISPSSEYSGLIFFRIDRFDLLASLRDSQECPAPQFKTINSLVLSLPYGPAYLLGQCAF